MILWSTLAVFPMGRAFGVGGVMFARSSATSLHNDALLRTSKRSLLINVGIAIMDGSQPSQIVRVKLVCHFRKNNGVYVG